jgi:hypothetical protein
MLDAVRFDRRMAASGRGEWERWCINDTKKARTPQLVVGFIVHDMGDRDRTPDLWCEGSAPALPGAFDAATRHEGGSNDGQRWAETGGAGTTCGTTNHGIKTARLCSPAVEGTPKRIAEPSSDAHARLPSSAITAGSRVIRMNPSDIVDRIGAFLNWGIAGTPFTPLKLIIVLTLIDSSFGARARQPAGQSARF